jgi:hypothetical protein
VTHTSFRLSMLVVPAAAVFVSLFASSLAWAQNDKNDGRFFKSKAGNLTIMDSQPRAKPPFGVGLGKPVFKGHSPSTRGILMQQGRVQTDAGHGEAAKPKRFKKKHKQKTSGDLKPGVVVKIPINSDEILGAGNIAIGGFGRQAPAATGTPSPGAPRGSAVVR